MRNVFITYRRLLVVLSHLALWSLALLGSLLLRFEFDIPRVYFALMPKLLLLTLTIRSLVFWRFGLFHGLWRYSGARDLASLLKAATLSSILVAAGWAFVQSGTFPRSILVLDWAFSILVVGGVRFSIRTVREVAIQSSIVPTGERRRRILVIGAGDAGEMLMRELRRLYRHRYDPVGFLDDAPSKQNEQIHGVPVLGPIASVDMVVKREQIDEVILAIPSMTGQDIRRIVKLCANTGVKMRTLPSVDSLLDGRVTVSQLTEVAIEDLLGRAPVTLDTEAIHGFLQDRVVLVTGAGGSIGSELCKQICRFRPRSLVLLEQAENSLFEVHRALIAEFPTIKIVPYVADICDSRRLETIFDTARPQVVFHAAAHKHVPMMESNPGEAIKNNVFGTKKVADMAHRFDVQTFVMVSTDKAVNPSSIMGVSKRTAEIYVQALSQRSRTQFVTVRFGNVLGSAGSVIPIFKQQIAAGGPVTVTHPDMRRYFMTIPEACQLIMQAGSMGRGGEIFILDMGEPVKVVDLARDLIRLSGYIPDEDIRIEFSGTRPGEKLFEELSIDAEKAQKTGHPKIFVGTFTPYPWAEVERGLDDLHVFTDGSSPERIQRAFAQLVPEFAPSQSIAPPRRDSLKAQTANEIPLATDRISITVS